MKIVLACIATCSLLALGGSGAALAQAIPAGYPADYASVIEGANEEGVVNVYSQTDAEQAKALIDAFNTAYPGITVQYTDITGVAAYNRVMAEAAAGQVGSDVVWSNAIDLQVALAVNGYAQAYKSPEAAAIADWGKYKDSVYLTTVEPVVFMYNKANFKFEPPKTHDDLLNLLVTQKEALTDKVETYDPEKSGQSYVSFENDSRKFPKFWELTKALGAVNGKLYSSAGQIREKLISGEHVLAFQVNAAYGFDWAKTAPNLVVAFPTDYTLSLSRAAFLTANSPHPNAGKLFLDFLMSKTGQEALAKGGLPSIRSDIDGPNLVTMNELAGGKLVPIALDQALIDGLDQKNRGEFFRKWKDALKD